MAARPARRPARPNPTRERILEASWRLFNELGVPNVTTNHIADEVDISPGNLYYHFRHKEDIVNALYDRYEQRFSEVLGYSADELSTPDDLWLALHLAFEIIYAYRFIYRDLSDLTTAYPGLRLRFQRSLEASIGKTREYLQRMARSGVIDALPEEISALAANMALVTAYWVNLHALRQSSKAISRASDEQVLAQGVFQVLSLVTPHLRGPARESFRTHALRYAQRN